MSDIDRQIERAYQKKVIETANKVKRVVAMGVLQQLIQTTPVDTGRAKSNWWTDTSKTWIEQAADNGASANAQGLSVSQRDIKLETSIYITNNLPYIQRLEDGWSAQAPAGFVKGAVQVGVARGKEAAREF